MRVISVPQNTAYSIESVSNALRLLLMLRQRRELRVTECAVELGVARSTAHRLLGTLEGLGFLRRDPARRTYSSGEALLAVGLSVIRNLDIRTRARPHIEALCEEVGETVNLVLLEGASIRFVDAVETPRALRVGGRVGLLLPAHLTSAGKAMLASLPREEVRSRFPDETLKTLTDASLTTRTELERALDEISRTGFAVARAESDPEISAVGVTVPQDEQRVPAGIAISAPASRLTDDDVERCAAAALATARRIAES